MRGFVAPLTEEQSKKDIARKAKPSCTTCGKFLYDSPQCTGHGGGGGGGGDSGEGAGNDDASNSLSASGQSAGITASEAPSDSASYNQDSIMSGSPVSSQGLSEEGANPSVIAKLLATNVLSVTNDRENGELSIKIDRNKWCELSPEERKELQKFTKFILQEFNEFKEQLDPSDKKKCVCSIENDALDKNNILSLNIKILDPTLRLYDKFIQQLTEKIQNLGIEKDDPAVNLIATLFQDKPQNEKEKAKENFLSSFKNENLNSSELDQEKTSARRITPLPTKPKPPGVKKLDES
jgi:hypothetical protein